MSLDDPNAGISYFDRDAASYSARYEEVGFNEVHEAIRRFLPAAPAEILDVGAGSGRDARALVQMGYRVTAVEPAPRLRTAAAARGRRIRWIDDRLPALSALQAEVDKYGFILCSAVLMLLQPDQLEASFAAMARLLAPGGRLAVSLRDPAPKEPRHIFHRHGSAMLIGAAKRAGLAVIDEQEVADALGRQSHRWSSYVFMDRRKPQLPAS